MYRYINLSRFIEDRNVRYFNEKFWVLNGKENIRAALKFVLCVQLFEAICLGSYQNEHVM